VARLLNLAALLGLAEDWGCVVRMCGEKGPGLCVESRAAQLGRGCRRVLLDGGGGSARSRLCGALVDPCSWLLGLVASTGADELGELADAEFNRLQLGLELGQLRSDRLPGRRLGWGGWVRVPVRSWFLEVKQVSE